MLDLNSRMNASVAKARKSGKWTSYGGLIVIIVSIITFIIEFLKMMHIARFGIIKTHDGKVDVKELEVEIDKIEEEHKEQMDSSNVF